MISRVRVGQVISVVFALSVAAPASGQTNTVDDFRELARKIVTESKIFPLMRAPVDGPSSPEPTVLLLATNDGTLAKARIGYLLTNFVSFDATFSAPVSGGAGRFLTQKGLGGGVSAEGSMRLVLYRKERSVPLPAGFMSGSRSLMGLHNLSSTVAAQRLTSPSTSFTFDQLVGAALESAQSVQAAGGPAAARVTIPSPAPIETPPAVMTAEQAATAATELSGDRGRTAFANAFRLYANDLEGWQVERSVVFSLGARAGRPEFTIADGAAFRGVTRKARTADISLGVIQTTSRDSLTRGLYLGLNVIAGTSYSGTQRQTCLPVGDSGGTQCRNALLSDPGQSDVELYQGDLRYFFSGLKFAVGLRPGYNRKGAENEKWSVEVPLMFLQNSKDLQSALTDDKAGLTGGITVGVRDSPDGNAFFAIFSVGSVFKLPGLPH